MIKILSNGDIQLKSTDTRPTTNIQDGTYCMTIDTKAVFQFSRGNVNPATGDEWWGV